MLLAAAHGLVARLGLQVRGLKDLVLPGLGTHEQVIVLLGVEAQLLVVSYYSRTGSFWHNVLI